MHLKNQITCFRKTDDESLFEACERYKELMRACTHHILDKCLIIHTFYNGLLYNTRTTIDVAAEEALMIKSFNDTYMIIKSIAQNHYQWGVNELPLIKHN